MKTSKSAIGLLLGVFLLVWASIALAQNSPGGAFLTSFNYIIGGQWTWRGQASPFVFEGATDNAYETTLTVTNPTADRTWTLPDATDQFVGRATTDTLTNKTITGAASVTSSGAITSSSASAGIGYATGAGCAVTQATSRTTGVTCTGVSGAITTDATSLAAAAEAEFTVTNTSVAVGDVVVVSARSGQTAGTSIPVVTAVAAGSFKITLTNLHATTADTGAMIINFAVVKAVGS